MFSTYSTASFLKELALKKIKKPCSHNGPSRKSVIAGKKKTRCHYNAECGFQMSPMGTWVISDGSLGPPCHGRLEF